MGGNLWNGETRELLRRAVPELCDDAVLEGSASTGRLAPNRALSIGRKVGSDEVVVCTKSWRRSSNGLEVMSFFVFRLKDCLWFPRKRGKNRRYTQTVRRIWLKIGHEVRNRWGPKLYKFRSFCSIGSLFVAH